MEDSIFGSPYLCKLQDVCLYIYKHTSCMPVFSASSSTWNNSEEAYSIIRLLHLLPPQVSAQSRAPGLGGGSFDM